MDDAPTVTGPAGPPEPPATPVPDPTWKRDFPYESAAEEDVTRREFARYLVAVG